MEKLFLIKRLYLYGRLALISSERGFGLLHVHESLVSLGVEIGLT